jgi:predicted acetyltransferase
MNNERRIALLLKINGALAGFTLLNNHCSYLERSNKTNTIAEFFIIRKWRRKGIGKYVANKIFNTFPGDWEVKQEKDNLVVQLFWETIINDLTKGNYKKIYSDSPDWVGPILYFNNEML